MAEIDERKIKDIVSRLERLEFGSLVVTVHNGEVTQIDTTEKQRYTLDKGGTSNK
ncbi:DUF2292 domain-containing protein [Halobacillus naozhouensis]|uniref:DUF2292 domain-containing protein n=1 Tax=Halobacillus naozhouensis TaxID=554880 RepID=A0ABY8IZ11_9BACI|nr:DUF2292 domain-containing protein [Halobacillus naozhouensis]WFT75061.1 DUF2292 domain-containing protein [Halobacillus naozhouensis]